VITTTARAKQLRSLAILAIAIATTGAAHSAMDFTSAPEIEEILIPPPNFARLMTFGFDAAFADYYWMRAVQVVGGGEASVGEDDGDTVARLLETVVEINPWVDHPYRFGAVWLNQSPAIVERANRLLEIGIAHHPTDWRNRYHLGFNQFYYLDRPLLAADTLESTIGLEGTPRYLPRLVARLRSSRGGLEVAAAFIKQLIQNADDEYHKAEYSKALDEIEIERRARFLDRAREEYWHRNGRDIEKVEDLLAGPNPVLDRLPRAQMFLDGFDWILDEETGAIVSSFYGARYELHVTPWDRERQRRWGEVHKQREGV